MYNPDLSIDKFSNSKVLLNVRSVTGKKLDGIHGTRLVWFCSSGS